MLTQEPTAEMLETWKSVWKQYKSRLKPNRKSGQELLDYLSQKYVLTEIHEKKATDAVFLNVTKNKFLAAKLPDGSVPLPRTFFLENRGKGEIFYQNENKDKEELWGGDITRIFVGIDTASGYFMVEGSTMLWDELCAFRGVDEADIQNYFCVAQYIACLKRFDLLKNVLGE
ncbi:MAG: hypothetical protein Q8865_10305 [Bacillota bacterium]|nr:hypothetical protein [Bacillota bacterium]